MTPRHGGLSSFVVLLQEVQSVYEQMSRLVTTVYCKESQGLVYTDRKLMRSETKRNEI